jgi:hypothetical protein
MFDWKFYKLKFDSFDFYIKDVLYIERMFNEFVDCRDIGYSVDHCYTFDEYLDKLESEC